MFVTGGSRGIGLAIATRSVGNQPKRQQRDTRQIEGEVQVIVRAESHLRSIAGLQRTVPR
jgi:NAD(P)-dependent dehydrogenase (short-subunit alcohol dehydrogenase family)